VDDSSVLGGEAPIWAELNSEHCVNAKIWPRAAALADKYWSPNVPTDLIAITERLNAFSEVLKGRNIPFSPITCRYCEINADHCFDHY
jgi:N-acetyl-beta-hexosaminidase